MEGHCRIGGPRLGRRICDLRRGEVRTYSRQRFPSSRHGATQPRLLRSRAADDPRPLQAGCIIGTRRVVAALDSGKHSRELRQQQPRWRAHIGLRALRSRTIPSIRGAAASWSGRPRSSRRCCAPASNNEPGESAGRYDRSGAADAPLSRRPELGSHLLHIRSLSGRSPGNAPPVENRRRGSVEGSVEGS